MNENFKVQKLSLEERKLELEKVKLKANYIKSPFKCDTCFKGFKVEATYTAHMLKHTEVRNYKQVRNSLNTYQKKIHEITYV